MRVLNHAEVHALADSFAQLVHALMFAINVHSTHHGVRRRCGRCLAAVFCCGCAHDFGLCRAVPSAFVPRHPAALASRHAPSLGSGGALQHVHFPCARCGWVVYAPPLAPGPQFQRHAVPVAFNFLALLVGCGWW